MSTPATRRSERKRAPNPRLADLDSSPTQRAPAASKKRKVSSYSIKNTLSPPQCLYSMQANGQAAPRAPRRKRTPEVQTTRVPDEASDDETALDEETEEGADLIIPYLKVASDAVAVADEYPNHRTEERYGEGNINAFAKICGREWTYYVQSSQIFFGRAPDGFTRDGPAAQGNGDDQPPIDIDLGPSKVVSRTHAELTYSQSDDGWHVRAYGRNGVKVDETNLKKGQNTKIKSGTIITIAGTEMLFESATGKTEIHPSFLDRVLEHQNNEGLDSELGTGYHQPLPDRPGQALPSGPSPPPPNSQQYAYTRPDLSQQSTVAPGPSDLIRPVTPESSPTKRPATGSAKKRSPNSYRGGIMMESTEQIDYALETSKYLKPGCSYASMITWAILSTEEEALSLSGIYDWIKDHYAFYRNVNSGWQVREASISIQDIEADIYQNSIRHNLSLNRGFAKVPRRPNEPGKGMKWTLVPEHRETTLALATKNASKGGGRVSSAPGTPAGGAKSGGFLPPPTKGTKTSPTDRSTPPLSSYPPAQQESYTPTRGSQMPIYGPTQGGLPVLSDETSPPHIRRPNGHLTAIDSSPTLTSGAWGQDAPMMRTPAPRPHNLNMPQPNTVKLPTSHLADSSPAPFWRFTPAQAWPDISPVKNGTGDRTVMHSSSPPPLANGAESPTRKAKPPVGPYGPTAYGGNGVRDEEDGDIDITKYD